MFGFYILINNSSIESYISRKNIIIQIHNIKYVRLFEFEKKKLFDVKFYSWYIIVIYYDTKFMSIPLLFLDVFLFYMEIFLLKPRVYERYSSFGTNVA